MVDKRKFKGVDSEEEKLTKELKKDVRPPSQKIADFLKTQGSAVIPFTCAIFILAFPNWAWYAFIINLPLIIYHSNKVATLPFKKPLTSYEKDPNQLHPATGKPEEAKGISFYGNDINSSEQLWFANDDLRTHTLIFGTTGSGKTEALLSLCINSLIQSSGFIYVDGKGDNSLLAKVFSIVRRFGREDDLLVINYMTGTVDFNKKSFEKLSNSINPFASGSDDALTELVVSLLPDSSDGMWKGRAAVFMAALMKVLVGMRDERKLLLDVDAIRQHFSLEKITELVYRDDINDKHKAGLREYLHNLPGFKKPTPNEPNPEQDFGVYEQHGFITMQYTEVFGLLADTYGHIMKTQLAEVDFYDVVVNRRILVVLLPALEKSPQSLANLGKIIVASVKSMMSAALGSRVEGNRKDVIDQKPTNAPSPYLTIFDEYGYYSVEGAAVMPAQARSLGFAMIFAGQDYQAFKKGSPEEAASIVANCAIKICMKLEDPSETLDIFNKAAGQAKVTAAGGFQYDASTGMGGSYVDQGQVSYENKERLNSRDLKSQGPGDAHIIFGDNLVRGKMFFANPTIVDNVQLNTFLKVKPPSYEKIKLLKTGYKKVTKRFDTIKDDPSSFQNNLNEIIGSSGFESELGTIIRAFKATKGINNATLKAFFALASYSERVAFVDNKIVYEISESEKPDELKNIEHSSNEGDKSSEKEAQEEQPSKEETVKSVKKKPKENRKHVDKTSNNKEESKESSKSKDQDKGESSTLQTLRSMVSKQQEAFERLKSSPFNPYEKMGIDEEELKSSLVETERNLNETLRSKNIGDGENYGEDYNDLVAQQTVASIGLSTSYPSKENRLINREENEKYINNIVESILLDDIENDDED